MMNKKKNIPYVIMGILVGAFLLAAISYFTFEFLEVDSCLDNGGRWNKTLNQCECSRTQTGAYTDTPSQVQIDEKKRCDALYS